MEPYWAAYMRKKNEAYGVNLDMMKLCCLGAGL